MYFKNVACLFLGFLNKICIYTLPPNALLIILDLETQHANGIGLSFLPSCSPADSPGTTTPPAYGYHHTDMRWDIQYSRFQGFAVHVDAFSCQSPFLKIYGQGELLFYQKCGHGYGTGPTVLVRSNTWDGSVRRF